MPFMYSNRSGKESPMGTELLQQLEAFSRAAAWYLFPAQPASVCNSATGTRQGAVCKRAVDYTSGQVKVSGLVAYELRLVVSVSGSYLAALLAA